MSDNNNDFIESLDKALDYSLANFKEVLRSLYRLRVSKERLKSRYVEKINTSLIEFIDNLTEDLECNHYWIKIFQDDNWKCKHCGDITHS